MSNIESTVDIDVPPSTAYGHWTRFDEFPSFMEGVEEVHPLDDSRQRWKAEIAGKQHQWEAEITERVPGNRIAWTTRQGPYSGGVVTFQPLEGDRTRVVLQMTYEPEGPLEKVGDMLGILERRVSGDLERFRDHVEERGRTPGAPG